MIYRGGGPIRTVANFSDIQYTEFLIIRFGICSSLGV